MNNFGSFSFKDVQTTISLLFHLKKEGIKSVDDVLYKLQSHVNEIVRNDKRRKNRNYYKIHKAKIPDYKCKKCEGPVYLLPVNVSRCTRTGDDSKTAIICYDEKNCGYIEYSKKSINSFSTRWSKVKIDRKGKTRFYEESISDEDVD